MRTLSLPTAIVVSGLSERTLWRRISQGTLTRGEDDERGRATVALSGLRETLPVILESEEVDLLVEADRGNAEAQNDVALLFMSAKAYGPAIYLLELAAKQAHPDAMHWLGRCYVDGIGVQRDEMLGLSWLTRAASAGHVISKEMVGQIISGAMSDRAIKRPIV